ncbi:CHAT domain-containing protein [Dactylosporangium sp. NPDC051541]|uniref:CHAT domain-containing protein n=1 Tax=Dactylosporangium sp. NPDC051541 TaxID=3363977 RepID=UPI0037B20C15
MRFRRSAGASAPALVNALIGLFRAATVPDGIPGFVPAARDRREAVTAARVAFEELTAGHPDPYATFIPLQYAAYLSKFDQRAAREVLTAVIERGAEPVAAHAAVRLGEALAEQGDYANAEVVYEHVVATAGDAAALARAWFRLGAIRLASDRVTEGAAAYAEAAALGVAPYSWMGRLNQAGALLAGGDADGARAAYVLAAELPEPHARDAAAEGIARIDGAGVEERAVWVAQRLVAAPDWYHTLEVLEGHLDLIPALIDFFEQPPELPEGPQYLRLLRRAAEAGVAAAVADTLSLGEDDSVPVSLRLLVLRMESVRGRLAVDATDPAAVAEARAAGAAVADAVAAGEDWDALPARLVLDIRGTLANHASALVDMTLDPELLELAAGLLRSLPDLAARAGADAASLRGKVAEKLRALAVLRPFALVNTFADAYNDGRAAAVLQRYPQLLGDELLADDGLRAVAEGDGDNVALRIRQGLRILRAGREFGAEAVLFATGDEGGELFLAVLIAASGTAPELRAAIHADPRLLSDETDLVLAVRLAVEEDLPGSVEEVRQVLRRCREIGIDRTFDEEVGPGQVDDLLDVHARASDALQLVEDAPDSATAARVFWAHRDVLLHDGFFALIEAQLEAQLEAQAEAQLEAQNELQGLYLTLHTMRTLGATEEIVAEVVADPGVYHPLMEAMLLTAGLEGAGPEALDEAGRAWAAAQATPMFGPGRTRPEPVELSRAAWLIERHKVTGAAGDIDTAVELMEAGANHGDPHGSLAAAWPRGLAEALLARFDSRGRADDIDRVVALLERAEADPQPSLDKWSTLAGALVRRFKRFGDRADVDRAVATAERHLAQEDAANPEGRNTLAVALSARYQATGRLDDLDRAIAINAALIDAPDDSPGWSAYLANYGVDRTIRYLRLHTPDDLDRAVDALRRAAEWPATQVAERSRHRSQLGNALLIRARDADSAADLRDALAQHEAALAATPADAAEYPNRLNNLGNAQLQQYYGDKAIDTLQAAIGSFERAVRASAADAPGYAWRAGNLAAALAERHRRRGDRADLDRAGRLYRHAVRTNLDTRPEAALTLARAWGDDAAGRGEWAAAAEAYAAGVEAVQRLLETQVLRDDYAVWLHAADRVFTDAAEAAARTGRPMDAALALERGRALVLAETLQRDRAVLDGFADSALAPLRDRFAAAADRLRTLRHAPADDGLAESALRTAHTELRAVTAEIRRRPGHAGFLRLPEAADLAAAAVPLVYLAAGPRGGLAVVVTGGRAETVELPELTRAGLDARVRDHFAAYADRARDRDGWAAALDDTCRWLWGAVMGPVVGVVRGGPATLVAAGWLGFLPLHAAWRPDGAGGRRYALDDLRISFAPSARVLSHVAAPAAAERVLVVRAGADLPDTAAETAAVRGAFAAGTVLTDVDDGAVLAALRDHDVVHFACHGVAEPAAPLDSALILAGGARLTMRRLLAEPHVARRLAVLSACETAVPGRDLPDEVVGLPGALLQAGVAGVVASLWAVPDRATMLLIRRFYEGWRQEGLSPGVALGRAQAWLRDASNGDVHARFPDLPAPHGARAYAIWAAARPYAHPYHWASFTHVGV